MFLNDIKMSVKEWEDYLKTGIPPSKVPDEVVKAFDKAVSALRVAKSYDELKVVLGKKFNPKPKNPPRKGYRAINLTPQWRLLFKIARVDNQTIVYIDSVRGDHKYQER